jgi:hypothetical protein
LRRLSISFPALVKATAITLLPAFLFPAVSARADNVIRSSDIQATVRALGFVDSLQTQPSLSIGVVFDGGDGQRIATQVAATIPSLHAPGSPAMTARAVSIADVAKNVKQFDVLYLMPASSGDAARIADVVQHARVVSISNDPACLDANTCVLFVRTGVNVEIVLNTALANAVNAQISPVFAILVKRR